MSLDQKDIIEIHRSKYTGDLHQNAVNFNYILRTGKVSDATVTSGDAEEFEKKNNYRIDWDAKDAFTRTLKKIEASSADKIAHSAELQEVLKKDHWSKADREKWEKGVSDIVAEETAKIPGFGHYRTAVHFPGATADVRTDATDIRRLNDLSSDLEHGTEKMRYDCGIESVVKGTIVQRLENDHGFLPKTAEASDYKKASSYFYATGSTTPWNDSMNHGGHASIFTPTGNTIEATIDGAGGYVRSKYPDSTLENFVRGRAFHSTDGAIYNQPDDLTGTDSRPVRAEAEAVHNPKIHDEGTLFSREELLKRARSQGVAITEAKTDDILMLSACTPKNGKDVCEMKVYQKEMAGTPQEGYRLVAYDRAEKHPVDTEKLQKDYVDPVTDKTYRFQSSFGEKTVQSDITRKVTVFDAKQGYDKNLEYTFDNRIAHSETAYAASRSPNPAAAQSDAIKAIQIGLGQIPTGVWSDKTSMAMEILLVRAQLTDVYKNTGEKIDGTYGPKTHLALEAMAAKGQISHDTVGAIDRLSKSGDLKHLYAPQDLKSTVELIKSDPDAMRMIAQIKPDAHAPRHAAHKRRPAPADPDGLLAPKF